MTQAVSFEKYLGKPFHSFNIGQVNLKVNKDKFSVLPKNISFYGKKIESINIKTDSQNNIVEFEIILVQVLSNELYQILIAHFGEPSGIFNSSSVISKEDFVNSEFTGKTIAYKSTRFFNLKERPFKVIWEKQNFALDVLIDYDFEATRILLKAKK